MRTKDGNCGRPPPEFLAGGIAEDGLADQVCNPSKSQPFAGTSNHFVSFTSSGRLDVVVTAVIGSWRTRPRLLSPLFWTLNAGLMLQEMQFSFSRMEDGVAATDSSSSSTD